MEQVKRKSDFLQWVKALALAFAVAACIRFFLFTPIVVDGESMMPTLENGDRMIVNKVGYMLSKPERFDIIVFHAPENKDYIKRIIGLPGDFIEYKDDQLYINGEPIDEPYLQPYKELVTDGPLTGDFTLHDIDPTLDVIPEGYVFVMGDNRRFSKDSRHIGIVHQREIIGDTRIIFWPLHEIELIK